MTEVSGNTTYLATESFDYLLHSDGGLVTLDLRKEGISRIVRSIASGFALISVRGRNEVTIRRFDREGRWLDELPIVIDTPGWSELPSADVEVFDDGGLLAAWSDGAIVRWVSLSASGDRLAEPVTIDFPRAMLELTRDDHRILLTADQIDRCMITCLPVTYEQLRIVIDRHHPDRHAIARVESLNAALQRVYRSPRGSWLLPVVGKGGRMIELGQDGSILRSAAQPLLSKQRITDLRYTRDGFEVITALPHRVVRFNDEGVPTGVYSGDEMFSLHFAGDDELLFTIRGESDTRIGRPPVAQIDLSVSAVWSGPRWLVTVTNKGQQDATGIRMHLTHGEIHTTISPYGYYSYRVPDIPAGSHLTFVATPHHDREGSYLFVDSIHAIDTFPSDNVTRAIEGPLSNTRRRGR